MTAPLILGTNSIKDEGYVVDNSLRFNDDSTDYLSRTPSSAGNQKKFTWSSWVKRSGLGYEYIFTQGYDGNNNNVLVFNADNSLTTWNYQGGFQLLLRTDTDVLFRDISAWYHIVVAVDTTQSTASDRAKMYINGVQITDFKSGEETYPSQNTNLIINTTNSFKIGTYHDTTVPFDGYMAEVVFIDGQQLDPTSFGEFDENSNIWKPKDVSGLTFGTNGFYLDFEDSSALGNDVSGNDNDFTVNNLTSIDQTTDTCTNNFCTWNSIADNLDVTLSEGNTKVVHGTALERRPVISNFGVSKGKWYWEWEAEGSPSGVNIEVGIVNYASPSTQGRYLGQGLQGDADFTTYSGDGTINMSGTTTTGLSTYTGGDIIGVAVDMDNTLIYFYKNNTLVNSGGTNFSGMEDGSGFIFMANADRSGVSTYTASVNFGNPNSAPSSSQSDGNGYGNFEYTPPSGYYALCTKNLAEYG